MTRLHNTIAQTIRRSQRRRYLLPSVARVLCFVFLFTNVVFAEKPVADQWKSRPRPVQLAALTPSHVDAAGSGQGFADVFSHGPAIQSVVSMVSSSVGAKNKKFNTTLFSQVPADLFAHVNIRSVSQTTSPQTVLILEDVHENVEAQNRLSQAIKTFGNLSGQSPVTVGLEGASGSFLYDDYKQMPDHHLATLVADSYLKTGDISGPAHAGFTSYTMPGTRGLLFWGVDDPVEYRANVAAYKASSRIKQKTMARLETLGTALMDEKNKVFNSRLIAFDRSVSAYRQGTLGMGDYATLLVGANAPSSITLDIFLQAYEMERGMNFKQVDSERAVVLEKLVNKMQKKDIQHLVDLSLGYQQGQVTFAEYYQHLKNLCALHSVDLARTPHFDEYVRYVLLADGINAEKLSQDLHQQEQRVYRSLAQSKDEQRLVAQSHQLYLMTELVNFGLTSEQWEEYKKAPAQTDLSVFEQFYRAADARSDRLVENLLSSSRSAARNDKSNVSLLIAGGFHTAKLMEQLRKKNISCIVASPKVTKIETALASASAYLSVFDREKTPLEKIFSGQKLFMVKPVAASATGLLTAIGDPTPEMVVMITAKKVARITGKTSVLLPEQVRTLLRKLNVQVGRFVKIVVGETAVAQTWVLNGVNVVAVVGPTGDRLIDGTAVTITPSPFSMSDLLSTTLSAISSTEAADESNPLLTLLKVVGGLGIGIYLFFKIIDGISIWKSRRKPGDPPATVKPVPRRDSAKRRNRMQSPVIVSVLALGVAILDLVGGSIGSRDVIIVIIVIGVLGGIIALASAQKNPFRIDSPDFVDEIRRLNSSLTSGVAPETIAIQLNTLAPQGPIFDSAVQGLTVANTRDGFGRHLTLAFLLGYLNLIETARDYLLDAFDGLWARLKAKTTIVTVIHIGQNSDKNEDDIAQLGALIAKLDDDNKAQLRNLVIIMHDVSFLQQEEIRYFIEAHSFIAAAVLEADFASQVPAIDGVRTYEDVFRAVPSINNLAGVDQLLKQNIANAALVTIDRAPGGYTTKLFAQIWALLGNFNAGWVSLTNNIQSFLAAAVKA